MGVIMAKIVLNAVVFSLAGSLAILSAYVAPVSALNPF
jgi:hypothetical protein